MPKRRLDRIIARNLGFK